MTAKPRVMHGATIGSFMIGTYDSGGIAGGGP